MPANFGSRLRISRTKTDSSNVRSGSLARHQTPAVHVRLSSKSRPGVSRERVRQIEVRLREGAEGGEEPDGCHGATAGPRGARGGALSRMPRVTQLQKALTISDRKSSRQNGHERDAVPKIAASTPCHRVIHPAPIGYFHACSFAGSH